MGIFYPINLRVDRGSSRAPVIASAQPVFSWGARHADTARSQSEWNIRVFDLLEPEHALWDSGWVGSDTQEAKYAGKKLPQGRRICWQLTLRDDLGLVSETAESEFITPLYEDWRAGWITSDKDYGKAAIYFRREFNVRPGLKNAVLFCCGIGYQYVSVNGTPAECSESGEALLQPVFSDFSRRCYYSTVPINGLIDEGGNCIGVVVASGWRNNCFSPALREGLRQDASRFMGRTELTAQLMLEYEDGSVEWILSDESWQCSQGGVVYADVFNGEHFDERLEPHGFDCFGFDASGFANAVAADAPGGKLMPAIIEPIVEQKRYPAKTFTNMGGGKYLIDFGTNIAGWIEIDVPAGLEPGSRILLRHAEELDGEEDLHTANLRGAEQTDIYITDGEECVWSPRFTYHGFRWATVEGLPGLDASMIEAVSFYNDVDSGSFFESGSMIANAIQRIILQTERDNIHHILTDCPQRDERQGWMNDATVRFEETPYNFDTGRIFPKIIGDITDCQGDDGSITCTAPFVFGNRPADPVCSSFLVAGLQNLMHYGDIETIREAYPRFSAWNDCIAAIAAKHDGIVDYTFYGDWAGPEDGCESAEGPRSAITPGALMSTGYHYHNCRLLAKMARCLGNDDEAKRQDERACEIRKVFLDKWWDAKTGTVATGSQACQAFALWLGILPEDGRALAAQRLNEAVESAGMRITTGNLCTRYLLDMLAEYGYIDTAWALVTREEYPSWGYMLQNGATTVWERFEMKENGGMNSHNHPMYGAMGYWFYAYLVGVRPTEPGWKRFKVKPYIPSKLTFAEAKIASIRGDIRVKWLKRYGKLILTVDVPFGCTADVEFDGKTASVGSGFHKFVANI